MTVINHHLTLVDGYGGGLEVTNQLAVYEHSSLPTLCGLLTSAIVDDYGYLVMNSKQVFRVSPLILYHKLLTSPPLASHLHYGVISLTLR